MPHMNIRRPGVCWCCATSARVRDRTYWVNGMTVPLCPKCEKTQAVLKLPKREVK